MEFMNYFAIACLLLMMMGLSGAKKALKRYSASLSRDPASYI